MTYPLIGNYGRLADDDQSIRPWLRALVVANATAAVLETRASSRRCCATHGIPAIAGRRHAGPRAPPARQRLPARDRDRAGRRRRRTPPGPPPRAVAALGGPGLRRPGLAAGVTEYGRADDGGPAHRDRRPRAQEQHRPGDAPPRRARPRLPAHGARRRTSLSSDIDGVDPLARPGRPGPPRGRRSRSRARSSTTAGRCSASASATRSSAGPPAPTRAGCGSATTARTTRSGTSSSGLVQVTAQNHEVQVVGDSLPAASGLPGQPGQPQRRLRRGPPPPRPADRDRPVPPRGRARARSTRWRSSTGSSRPRRRGTTGPP